MELTRPVGTNEITPVVHNGVMFVNSHRTVLGIDVESSEIRWKYVRASDTRQVGRRSRSLEGSESTGIDSLFRQSTITHLL